MKPCIICGKKVKSSRPNARCQPCFVEVKRKAARLAMQAKKRERMKAGIRFIACRRCGRSAYSDLCGKCRTRGKFRDYTPMPTAYRSTADRAEIARRVEIYRARAEKGEALFPFYRDGKEGRKAA